MIIACMRVAGLRGGSRLCWHLNPSIGNEPAVHFRPSMLGQVERPLLALLTIVEVDLSAHQFVSFSLRLSHDMTLWVNNHASGNKGMDAVVIASPRRRDTEHCISA